MLPLHCKAIFCGCLNSVLAYVTSTDPKNSRSCFCFPHSSVFPGKQNLMTNQPVTEIPATDIPVSLLI